MWLGRRGKIYLSFPERSDVNGGVGWIVAGLVGALPFYISGHIPHSMMPFLKRFPDLQRPEPPS